MQRTQGAGRPKGIHLAALAATLFAASTADAQTLARTEISRGCIGAAPTDSLRTETADAYVFRHDSAGIFVIGAESVPLQGR